MLPYLFLITLVSFCSVLDYVKLNTKSRKILLVLLIGLLIMFCGTRFETGNVVIPSFAVGRTQEILYFLRKIKVGRLVKEIGRAHV